MVSTLDLDEEILPTDSHHISKCFEINLPHTPNFTPAHVKRNFTVADYGPIVNLLTDTNWNLILSGNSLDDNIESFYTVINESIENFIPFAAIKPNSYPEWFDTEMIKMICDKKRAHSLWKSSSELNHYIEFKRLRAACVRLSRVKYRNYINSVECSLKKNIKNFWSFLKKLNKESNIPSKTYLKDTAATNEIETTELFSRYFGTVYSNGDIDPVPPDQ